MEKLTNMGEGLDRGRRLNRRLHSLPFHSGGCRG